MKKARWFLLAAALAATGCDRRAPEKAAVPAATPAATPGRSFRQSAADGHGLPGADDRRRAVVGVERAGVPTGPAAGGDPARTGLGSGTEVGGLTGADAHGSGGGPNQPLVSGTRHLVSAPRPGPRAAHSGENRAMRNLTQDNITEAVLARLAQTPDPRLKEIMTSLVRHLHAFSRARKAFTEEEWFRGIEFLTRWATSPTTSARSSSCCPTCWGCRC